MSVTPRRALVLFGIALLWTAGCSSPSGNPKVPAGAKSSGGRYTHDAIRDFLMSKF